MDMIKKGKGRKVVTVNVDPAREKKANEAHHIMTEAAIPVVDSAIRNAVQHVEEATNPYKNIDWITHGEFTVEKGREQIDQFIATWEHEGSWVHATEFAEKKDLIHSFHYIYHVYWSFTTPPRPLAKFSALAYFIIKFNKSKPPHMPVDVLYYFEESKLIHRPGMSRFREQWLHHIIDAKYSLLKSITTL
ncbi:A-kinase anchor protein 14 [Ochotona curzoniae]|uniref:A-kinase anchor protein 14 n=1 Tax=Ochotona curzoniae TaxID=130825 RepID=UPI001B3524D1|nr:A-kinase anchor protein 14 [Ochotona curzoniae]